MEHTADRVEIAAVKIANSVFVNHFKVMFGAVSHVGIESVSRIAQRFLAHVLISSLLGKYGCGRDSKTEIVTLYNGKLISLISTDLLLAINE
jgi:hypothetical protein